MHLNSIGYSDTILFPTIGKAGDVQSEIRNKLDFLNSDAQLIPRGRAVKQKKRQRKDAKPICSCHAHRRAASAPLPQSLSVLRHTATMTKVRNFVTALAGTGKSYALIKTSVGATFGDKALKKASIYFIMEKVKAGKTTDNRRH
jgi:hypothetical protein